MYNYEFSLWIDGFRTLCSPRRLNHRQLRIIRNHLNLVLAVCGRFDRDHAETHRRIGQVLSDGAEEVALEEVFPLWPAVAVFQTDTEFAYWLQGAIEIGDPATLSAAQCATALGRMAQMTNPGPVSQHLASLLHTIEDNATNPLPFEGLRVDLNSYFHHDVDPSYAGDQQFLGLVHDGLLAPDAEVRLARERVLP